MKRTTRRLATAGIALGLLLAGSTALAGQGRGGAPGRGIRAALAGLDLTDAQEAKVKELLEGEKTKFEALRTEGRSAREALAAASKSATPDPETVGAAFLRVDAHRKAMKAERASSRQKLEALLTPEQRAKLEGWTSAHRQMRRAAFGPRNRGGER